MDPRCIHDLSHDQCGDCKKPPKWINEFVFVTEQGQAFHNWENCAYLIAGQNFAQAKGFNVHNVVPKKWSTVFSSKGACEWCCAVYLLKGQFTSDSVAKIDGQWVNAHYVKDRFKENFRREYQVVIKSTGEIALVDEEDFKY